MDKREDIIDKVRNYKALVEDKFPMLIEKVYLFGSYAKGTPREHSDIDIALVIQNFGEDFDFLKTVPQLWLLGNQVDFRIEPHLIARDTDYAGFLDEIQKTGVEIN